MSEALPRIVGRRAVPLSPWVTVSEKAVARGDGEPQLYHSLAQADYVSVLARTAAGDIVLVRQFRPAWERATLELPGGLLDPGETPEVCALRELAEETGCRADRPVVPLGGGMIADTGRLENRVWGFFADGVRLDPQWTPEPGVERLLVPTAEFLQMTRDGRFDHALHVALVGMALLLGVL
jgi:ADP-ribose pyrophosphatase